MAHHAYVWSGDREAGIARARSYASRALDIPSTDHPDLVIFRHGLFSVDDARKLASLVEQGPVAGTYKAFVISVTRLFHEAQNALLKIFEEPPAGIVLILIVPSEGILLPTLRSRLITLPQYGQTLETTDTAKEFLESSPKTRETYIGKLLDRIKSDKEDVKQAARSEALHLVEGITRAVHMSWSTSPKEELAVLLKELNTFTPILHERSAPYKMIFEHLLLTIPPKV